MTKLHMYMSIISFMHDQVQLEVKLQTGNICRFWACEVYIHDLRHHHRQVHNLFPLSIKPKARHGWQECIGQAWSCCFCLVTVSSGKAFNHNARYLEAFSHRVLQNYHNYPWPCSCKEQGILKLDFIIAYSWTHLLRNFSSFYESVSNKQC